MNSARSRNSSRATMPLHCTICPKKPEFSDISHLLTHIGSKGHLANYFNVEVKAASDPESKRVFDTYMAWHETWNVRDLMHERLKQKERKRGVAGAGSRRGSAVHSASSTSTTLRDSTPISTDLASRRARSLQQSMLDPQRDRRIKIEPQSRLGTPTLSFARDSTTLSQSYAAPTDSWSAAPYEYSPAPFEATGSYYPTSSPWSGESEEVKPRRLTRRGYSGSTHSVVADEGSDDMVNDASKLKGVYWTGMGMFDSATSEMRRKRNQKKATSVVQFLKATSEVVEPTELVFDTKGILRRQRLITGNPDDTNCRLEGESTPEPDTPPKKTKTGRKPRQALREKDANTGRVLRTRSGAAPPRGQENRKRNRPYYDGLDEDDDLTYERPRPKRRNGISVHRDNSGPDISFGGTMISQARVSMDTLTSGLRPPFAMCTPLSSGYQQANRGGYLCNDGAHHRDPSLGFNVPDIYRPGGPPTVLPSQGFGSFGNINPHQPFYTGYSNPFAPNATDPTNLASQLGFGNLNSCYTGPFPTQAQMGNHAESAVTHPNWDFFDVGNQDLTMPTTTADMDFPSLNDFTTSNPLFFGHGGGGGGGSGGNNDGLPTTADDDEATISAPPSPHGEGGV